MCLLEYEEQLILKQKSSSQPQTIAAVNTVLKVRISDCKKYLTLKFLTILIQKQADIWSGKREISIEMSAFKLFTVAYLPYQLS